MKNIQQSNSYDESTFKRKLYMLYIVFGVAYVWNISGQLRVPIVSNHLSNFALTGIATTSLLIPIFKKKLDLIWGWYACLAFIAVNILVELVSKVGNLDVWINQHFGNFNTTDPIDAVFGIAAVCLVALVMLLRGSQLKTET